MSRSFPDIIALVDLSCWLVCFWWMHRISTRQNAVLAQLQRQGSRIEEVSKEEHQILTELHPAVQKIEQGIEEVTDKVSTSDRK